MRRRLVRMILIAGIVTTVMTGCGKREMASELESDVEEFNQETVSLTVWGSESDQELLREMAAAFQKQYEHEAVFEITVEPVSEGDCKEKLLGDVYEGADVFTFPDDQFRSMAAAGVLEPITDADKVRKANSESSVEAASINETIYAYPMTADNGYFMFYNKAYFTEDDITSLDRMLEVAKASGKKVSMELTSGWYLYSFFGCTGLELGLNPDGVTNYCNWNSTTGEITGIQVAEAMLAITTHDGFLGVNDEIFVTGVKSGEIIAGVSGIWNASMVSEAWGENWGAAKLPTYTCGGNQVQMSSFAGYKMVGVNAYSIQKEWAMKLADWITNEENQTLRFTERALGPSNIKAAESSEVAKSQAINALLEQSEFASLQRLSERYWSPTEEFANIILAGNPEEVPLQELLDTMVGGIISLVEK